MRQMAIRAWIFSIILVIVFFALFAILVPTTSARMGYDITVNVDGAHWAIHRQTMQSIFSLNATTIGSGKFSKYSHINGFAGIGAKETASSSQPGFLKYEEQKLLQAREGPVIITAALSSSINESENETHINVSAGDVTVDERWPTYFASRKLVSYLGPGMRCNDEFMNNGDTVSSSLDSWKLSEYEFYMAHVNRSYIHVKFIPPNARIEWNENKSSRFNLGINTTGSSAGIKIVQRDLMGDEPKLEISQDYVGQQNMVFKVNMGDFVLIPTEDTGWLDCCPDPDSEEDRAEAAFLHRNSGDISGDISKSQSKAEPWSGLQPKSIFDATTYRSSVKPRKNAKA